MSEKLTLEGDYIKKNKSSTNTGMIEISTVCTDIPYISCPSELYLDDNFIGYTPIQLLIPVGNHNYKLIKSGYTGPLMTGVANIKYGIKLEVSVGITDITKPGSVLINSTPEGARIFIDDKDQKALTPSIITDLPIGDHTYKLALAGYEDISGTFTTVLGQPASINATLIQLPEFGMLNIIPTSFMYKFGAASPYIIVGSEIYIDDINTGKHLPIPITGLTKGSHTFKITKPGLEDITGDFIINGGDKITISVISILKPDMGILILDAYPFIIDPKIAKIYIDDIDIGFTTIARLVLPVGSHTYRLTLSEFEDIIGTVEIIKNRLLILTPYMTQIGMVQLGILRISSDPPGARVYIDDVDMSQFSPTVVKNLFDGDYSYRITKIGFRDSIGTFTMAGGQTLDLHVNLDQVGSIASFSSNVVGIPIYIDENLTGYTTPSDIIGLSSGTHTYKLAIPELYGDGFYASEGTFDIIEGKTVIVDSLMKKKVGVGSLTIESIPSGAQVIFDDIDLKAATPYTATSISPGTHKIKLIFPGYQDWEGSVIIISGSTITITESMNPL